MDLTPEFRGLIPGKAAYPSPLDIAKLNGFMQDAYRINTLLNDLVAYLRQIKAPYLALQAQRARGRAEQAQALSEKQRKDADEAMKTQLLQINKSLEQLSEATKLDIELKQQLRAKKQEKRGFGRLGRWANIEVVKTAEEEAEDALWETEKAHRDGIILYLRARLQKAGKAQERLVSTRLNREIERSQNILSKSSRPANTTQRDVQPSLRAFEIDAETQQQREKLRLDLESQMTPSQLQQVQLEENEMVKHYTAEREKIQQAQTSITEIADLQVTLMGHLSEQAEGISQLVGESFEIGGNVKEGNKQLQKAGERFRPAQWTFYVAVCWMLLLVLWDLIF